MTDLEKYEAVNKAKTLTELANVIRSFAVEGVIRGRTRSHDAEKMAQNCIYFELHAANMLTREFGIRQQAMMLHFYEKF